jgi:CheY-like chemotaxis protein
VSSLSNILNKSPTALIVLNAHDQVIDCNEAAHGLGFELYRKMSDYLSLSEPFVTQAKYQPETHIYSFQFTDKQKRLRATIHEDESAIDKPASDKTETLVWLVDVTEQLVVAERARQLMNPDAKRLRQISQQAMTALGYTELLDVVLADNLTLSPDKLVIVAQYQAEVAKRLREIQTLIAKPEKNISAKMILVAEGHQALTELITELLRTEGYKVVGFTDAHSVLEYLRLNPATVSKAIIDEALKDGDSISLIERIREAEPTVKLIVLSDRHDAKGSIQKPLDFQVLLEAMYD